MIFIRSFLKAGFVFATAFIGFALILGGHRWIFPGGIYHAVSTIAWDAASEKVRSRDSFKR